MSNIHPTAIVSPGAIIPTSATVGPYCIGVATVEGRVACEATVMCALTTRGKKPTPPPAVESAE